MNLDDLLNRLFSGDLSSGIAAIGALVAAVFAWRAARQADGAMRTTANQYASELALQADQLFIQQPDLRPYFFDNYDLPAEMDGESDEDSKLRHRLEAAAALHLDVMEAILDHRGRFEGDDVDAWREWIHGLMQTSPCLRATYAGAGADWYPSMAEMIGERKCDDDKHEWARDPATPSQAIRLSVGSLLFDVTQTGMVGTVIAAIGWIGAVAYGHTSASTGVAFLVTGAALGASLGAIRSLYPTQLSKLGDRTAALKPIAVRMLGLAILGGATGAIVAQVLVAPVELSIAIGSGVGLVTQALYEIVQSLLGRSRAHAADATGGAAGKTAADLEIRANDKAVDVAQASAVRK